MRCRQVLLAALFAIYPALAGADPLDAVFKIEVPSGYPSPMNSSDAKPKPQDANTITPLKTFCRDGLFCLYFTGSRTGTAFLDEEPDRIVTGLFMVAGFLQSYWKDIDPDRLEDIPVPLALLSQDGWVFGKSDGDRATVTVSREDKRVVETESFVFNLHANSVTLRLSRRLRIDPLRRAPTRTAANLTVNGYRVGNAHLEGQSGRHLSGPPDFSNGRSASRESKNMIGFADYKGFEGLLGAPVMNENHEVVGIQLGATDKMAFFGWLVGSGLLSYPETAIDGFVTANVQTSPDKCRSICLERSGCAAFSHRLQDNACRLFSNVSAAQPSQGSVAGSREPIAGYRDPSGSD
ncbi:hypothetical protein HFO56_03025 [Rhizobium laguerreae]|uniref:PAN domain-containing protein n=1 Tax=Rhizobium laguerreae TaxID=1076926 RepID=UPI001C925BD1|nr:PAN domain-containing protein [Rhizobium laguerreae]MBY3151360.1 hypothetical protein [Rhizobium laguerreae]